MDIARTLESFIQQATNQVPVLIVTGSPQVGKTSLLVHLSRKDRSYVSLDDPMVRTLAKSHPALFLQRFPPLF